MEGQYDKDWYNTCTHQIIAAAIDVHTELGPGFLESVYESCLEMELLNRGFLVQRQLEIPLFYKGEHMGNNFRVDLMVNNEIIVELKAVDEIRPIHEIQLVSYLRLANKKVGLLINFNVPLLKTGIRRKINGNI